MSDSKQTIIIAGAIFLGFALVAAAIFFSNSTTAAVQKLGEVYAQPTIDGADPRRSDELLRRIYGSPEAETTIVEFSDYECPFCARVHPTIKRIVDESNGTINWEYRHLPLPMHANARVAAIASECVADLNGNEAFWNYSDVLLGNQRSITGAFLESTATALGVDLEAYRTCVANEDIAARVTNDVSSAQSLGGSGTPFSVIRFADGSTRNVSGALPYNQWQQVIER